MNKIENYLVESGDFYNIERTNSKIKFRILKSHRVSGKVSFKGNRETMISVTLEKFYLTFFPIVSSLFCVIIWYNNQGKLFVDPGPFIFIIMLGVFGGFICPLLLYVGISFYEHRYEGIFSSYLTKILEV